MDNATGVIRIASGTLLALVLTACTSQSQVIKTFRDPLVGEVRFSNVLVIGVADDYDGRAQFEREIVAAISRTGAGATAYYTVIGRNPQVTRNDVTNSVRARGFDAVLLTRVKGQENKVSVRPGSTEAKVTRRDGTAFNLFRYDYEVLNEPDSLSIETTVTLSTELYSAAEQRRIWSIDTLTFDGLSAGQIISEQVDLIVGELRNDGLLGR